MLGVATSESGTEMGAGLSPTGLGGAGSFRETNAGEGDLQK